MFNLQEIAPATYLLPQENEMKVPGLLIGTPDLLDNPEMEKTLSQVRNVASLPGIVGYSIAMPDMHWGYGFPIGGVAATDAETGVISPGGVGYDINCGVRLALVDEPFAQFTEKQKRQLLEAIFKRVPSGVGHGQRHSRALSEQDYRDLLIQGAQWSVDRGMGLPQDLEHSESHGRIEGADPSLVSTEAKQRGKNQLGSIGSGNHFVEIGALHEIFLPSVAADWGVKTGMTYILIHSGSRGFGHQVCQDTLNLFIQKGWDRGLPDRQLVAAPLQSQEGKAYFHAMAAAANFAFNNRQQILHEVRSAFQEVLGIASERVRLLYDVCHNIAKMETHLVEGKPRCLCVHRKGATRAFGPGSTELAPLFRQTGQPVLVPGDMGRCSYLLVGSGNPRTWCSCCHGAGRARSRVKSLSAWKGKDLFAYMEKQQVLVMASSGRTVAEEMPDAYKDVDQVVKAVELAGLSQTVAKLKPHLVIKG